MSKLTIDDLKNRSNEVASDDLLNTISGGTENACHDDEPSTMEVLSDWVNDYLPY